MPSKINNDRVMSYQTSGESMSLADKEAFLKEIGQGELVSLFDNHQPPTKRVKTRRARARKATPLDQKMTLTVTKADRKKFEEYMGELKKSGEHPTISTVVRNKALSTPDIEEWRTCAVEALKELKDTVSNKKDMRSRLASLETMIADEKDKSVVKLYHEERTKIQRKLSRLKGHPSKRTERLSGRMTFAEAELIRWRAARLGISTSDYLRMMIFDMVPFSEADEHMSLQSRQRFYISIGEVSRTGWGEMPVIHECSQCEGREKEIARLENEISMLHMQLEE